MQSTCQTFFFLMTCLYVVESPERLALHGACEENRGTWVLPGHSLPHGYVYQNKCVFLVDKEKSLNTQSLLMYWTTDFTFCLSQTSRQWVSVWRAGTTRHASCSWPTCSASSLTVENTTLQKASTISVPTCWRNSFTPRSKKRASSRSRREEEEGSP